MTQIEALWLTHNNLRHKLSRIEYLIQNDNTIVLDWHFNLTKKSDLIGWLKNDLVIIL